MAGIMMIAIKSLVTQNVQLKSAVAKQEAVNAQQRKTLEAFAARLEKQDSQIQKVNAQLQLRKPIQSLARNIP
jgi:predicted phage gp36 major capsid-like protein